MSTDLMKTLEKKANTDSQRVVFPEAHDAKILQAARRIVDMGIADPIVTGDPRAIGELADQAGICLDGITVVDINDEQKREVYSEQYAQINSLFPAKTVAHMLKNALNFAAVMVKLGEADCMVAGLSHTTGEVIMASEMIIGLQEGISTVSSMGILDVPGYQGEQGSLMAIADCAVVPAPDANELADIAIATADTVTRLLGWEPRVALLSFSTKASADHEHVDRVRQALEQVKTRKPDLLVDGEFQLDAAIVPEVAAKKVKGQSPVAGRANTLIFPDLNAGNIGVKLVQRFARGVAYGPLLQGFARPVCDLSRGASVEEIVGATTMVAVCAQGG
ncbi:MAG: phosphotransacetylase [Desulfatitalea sp.]|nr:phosphotransacetylase [Desulfatitalea sp.]